MDQTLKLRLTKPLRVGTCNVRTVCGSGAARILAAELERARVDIMANRGTGRGEEGDRHTRRPALLRLT